MTILKENWLRMLVCFRKKQENHVKPIVYFTIMTDLPDRLTKER